MSYLGQALPAAWSIKRLGFVATVKARLGWKGLLASEYVDEGYVFLATPNIKAGEIDFADVNYITAERYLESPEIMLQVGDVLLAKDGSTLGVCAPVRHLPRAATVNGSIAVIRTKPGLDSIYLFYLLMSAGMQSRIQEFKDGMGVPHLFQSDIRKFSIILPSSNEQRQIADFLDRETMMIDNLIANKNKLVKLISEKRAARIANVTLHGLSSAVAAKKSGLPTVGDIPSHWEVVRAKVLFREIDERVNDSSTEKLLTVSHITGVTPRSEKPSVTMFMAESLEGYKRCRQNDLVINTMWAWMGALGFTHYDGIVSPGYNVYRLKRKMIPEYLDHLYRTREYIAELTRWSKGVWVSRLRLYPDEFFQVLTLVPPLEEQEHIVAAIREETGGYDNAIRVLQDSVERLMSYRTSLITAAVTGQIDVHNYKAQGVASCQ